MTPTRQALREAGVPIAIGTDLNPGSSPVHDLWTTATLSTLIAGLTMEEALLGITRHAAQALGLHDRGHLALGAKGDIALFSLLPVSRPRWSSCSTWGDPERTSCSAVR